ncbi:LolA-like putative outer membrane lipoprotein chaperone [Prevotella nigrescens]|mgnify:FL=1|uniref:LolA-like putative outer membrane lipoprotein chaperone n=1 Tax=Prevotella nigrescens TaxID=28133 RepID=UPI00288B1CC1|nr:LolA-like putative outer membrane lipoprotein chaperone [Prevotella nigrescens]
MKIQRNILFALAFILSVNAFSQSSADAKKVLDKAAAVVGRRGGAAANFSITGGEVGRTSGSIIIKGNKFKAITPETTIWFDGKTQWAYMKSTNEVNVSTPSEAKRLSMNPYAFITMYKNGYHMSMKTTAAAYIVHLQAIHPARSMQEFYVTISKTFYPQQIKMLQGKKWVTINISSFRAASHPNSYFRFRHSDAPSAEVVDLR